MSYERVIDQQADLVCGFAGGIAEGANVRTPCGPRRIELVRPGDLIVTRDDGLQPVRLVWARTLTAAEICAQPGLAPIRLMPRVIGPMMPQHPLRLAPDQRLLTPGFRIAGQPHGKPCLVEARDIAGSSDAAFVDRGPSQLRLFALVFDAPQVFTVNGLPVASFVPAPARVARLDAPFRDALLGRYPQLKREPNAYPPERYGFVAGAECLPLQ